MRLVAEFTTEPFHGEGEPPPHATSALEALRAAGVDCEFGPLGTSAAAEAETLLDALKAAVSAALANGADTVTLQVRRADAARRTPSEASPGSLEGILADVAGVLGGPLSELPRADKQRAVRMLEERGAFAYRKSAETVAEALGVTRFTVYNYLNRAR
jgi:uncharacterized protein YqgV (UPF0045/DUF77 family)